ncbi:MAG: ribonuclease PH [Planctomycetota bacterium]|nr:ribonuclease PH [Planctomycetota bacterium]
MPRKDNRAPDQHRPIKFTRSFTDLPGSVLAECGQTMVLCTVGIQDQVPHWMYNRHQGGWLTAEYSMLPNAGSPRKPRDGRTGRPLDGRTQEIQRLIGRALRCAVDLKQLPEVTLWVDCDVLQADGGTRTTSINGAIVALYDALLYMEEQKRLPKWPMRGLVSAISVGLKDGQPLVDLDYHEDSAAEADLNVICASDGKLIEVQGAAEKAPFAVEQFHEVVAVGQRACEGIDKLQRQALGI